MLAGLPFPGLPRREGLLGRWSGRAPGFVAVAFFFNSLVVGRLAAAGFAAGRLAAAGGFGFGRLAAAGGFLIGVFGAAAVFFSPA